jgi:CobQ-like glutamine amidotransferase family enzyme
MVKFKVLHLYPSTLKLNGESGNVLALLKRAELLGLDTSTSFSELGMSLPAIRPDLIFIGSGVQSATLAVAEDLLAKAQQIRRWVSEGSKVLAVGTGFDLISEELVLLDGTVVKGLALTNTRHRITGKHLVGEVVLESDFAGFINSDRSITRGSDGLALGKVKYSDESRLIGYLDGYSDGKVWASNVQGPLLPMNPHLADKIISAIFPKIKITSELSELDLLASKARNSISARISR